MKLKGSKTEKNLRAAFTGESMARSKYTHFAEAAKKEGFEQIAEVFSETAENEKIHAKRVLDFLKEVGNTKANLKAAAEGEHREWTEMYVQFEQIAREEELTEVADFFKGLARVEEEHEKRYLALLKDVNKKNVFKKGKKGTWKCSSCGWLYEDIAAPNVCPTCRSPQGYFGLVE
ncbi:MAG: ferritin family protein, partial [Dehalococcoidales bacterium]|nr:ferritin family protein [Dehalococcoidales bacterium]